MQSVISQQTIHKCDNDKGRVGCLMQVSWLVMCAAYFIEGDDNDFDYIFWMLQHSYHIGILYADIKDYAEFK